MMNAFIATINHWGEMFLSVAWPMLWQSSLLIVVVFALDFLLARRIRPAIRHALWMVVLVKLVLPPALALPTGVVWWLCPAKPALAPVIKTETVTYDTGALPYIPIQSVPIPEPVAKLDRAGWIIAGCGMVSIVLLLWLAFNWLNIAQKNRRAIEGNTLAADSNEILEGVRQLAGAHGRLRLKLIDGTHSPAVFGFFRPVILLPRALAERLSPAQLRAVLLHEAIHVRRGDVWVNCAQTLLQICYWWHPLLWLANARIRRLREEAVDDAVMAALRDDAAAYAPTLLEVARFAFRRPLASLGLIGILESRSALRGRIERLVDFRPPRRTGVTFLSLCGILAFSAAALPMGQAPVGDQKSSSSAPVSINTIDQNAATHAGDMDPARKEIYRTLKQVHFTVSCTNEPLSRLIADLHARSVLQDPEKSGINFLFNPGEENVPSANQRVAIDPAAGPPARKKAQATKLDPARITISMNLTNVSLAQLVEVICMVANYPIKYSVEDFGIVFSPEEPGTPQYEMRTFQVDRNQLLAALKPIFEAERDNVLTGTNELPVSRDSGDGLYTASAPSLATDTSTLFRQFLEARGINLRPPKTIFFNDRLGVLFVYATPQDLDIIESNIVRICNTNSAPLSAPREKPSLKPDFWLQLAVESYEEGDLDKAELGFENVLALDPGNEKATHYMGLIAGEKQSPAWRSGASKRNRIDSELLNVVIDRFGPYNFAPLRDVIEDLNRKALAAGADFKISLISPEPSTNEILVNQLKLSNVSLESALDAIVETASQPIGYSIMDDGVIFRRGDSFQSQDLEIRYFHVGTPAFIDAVRERTGDDNVIRGFKQLALEAGVSLNPPKTVFLSEGKGMLWVQATPQDLDVFEKILASLNCPPSQFHIKARFFEVPKSFFPSAFLPRGMTNGTGVLTATETRKLVRQLGSLKDCVELAQPEVVTIQGQLTQVRATMNLEVVTNFACEMTSKSLYRIIPQTGRIETGPALDVVPMLFTDEYTINLGATASLREFFGYANTDNLSRSITNAAGDKVTLPIALPIFQDKRISTQKSLYDGQSLVMFPEAGTVFLLPADEKARERVAEYVRKADELNGNKVLMAVVTATLIDGVGNRIHSDADMSFAQNSFPPQWP